MKLAQVGEQVEILASHNKTIYESDGYQIVMMKAKYQEGLFPQPPTEGHRRELFFVKGKFITPSYKEQSFRLTGMWVYDKAHNKYQFSVKYAIPVVPTTEKETLAFLLSVKGVGKVSAERLCDYFHGSLEGQKVDVIELSANVKGIKQSAAKSVKQEVQNINASFELSNLLKSAVSGEVIREIVVQYGTKAMEKVCNEPYEMAIAKVVPFQDADAIALHLGGNKNDEERIRACVITAMRFIKTRTSAIIIDKRTMLAQVMKRLVITQDEVVSVIKKMIDSGEIVSDRKYCYMAEDFTAETELALNIIDDVKTRFSEKESGKYLRKFEEWKCEHAEIKLAERQEEAVKAVADSRLSIVTGGPGTGKTTVLKAIMQTYRKAFPDSEVTLMAPTGLAAKRMTEACGEEAGTIHSCLNLIPCDNDAGFVNENDEKIPGGLVIIDEFSMVGIHLAHFLFSAIENKADTRIVIVGDIDQLPPVSPGAVLQDLISGEKVRTTRLNRNFRQEAGSAIVDGAYAINAGDTNLHFTGNFQFLPVSHQNIQTESEQILEAVKTAFSKSIQKYGLNQSYVLAPRRKAKKENGKITADTLLSTAALNPVLRDVANPYKQGMVHYDRGGRSFRVGDRVINLKNTDAVMNGEIGLITDILFDDVPTVVVSFDGKKVEFTPDKLNALELAYAITVHKSQGCEFASVIYPTSMTQSVMLQRNLLYTAVTRAKKNVLIIGNKHSIDVAVTTVKKDEKRSLLMERIVNGCKDS